MSDPDHDLIFQATDWNYFHNKEDDDEDSSDEEDLEDDNLQVQEKIGKYTVQMYGTMIDNKKIYLQVDNFKPYFYFYIPQGWKKRNVRKFVDELMDNVNSRYRDELISWKIVQKHKFWGFTDNQLFKFVKLTFESYDGFRQYRSIFDPYKRTPKQRRTVKRSRLKLERKCKKFKLYESNIEPLLRMMHHQDITGCGWVKAPAGKYKHFSKDTAPSHNDINIRIDYKDLEKVDNKSISKLKVASFDIECDSGDGKFPQAKDTKMKNKNGEVILDENGKPKIRKGDPVIQIGTTFNRCGEKECYFKHIITLGSCDPIEGVTVESYKTEKQVLLAWTKLIRRMNPDIITGYNIFGFDYKYLKERAEYLGIYDKFSQLGRLKNKVCEYTKKELKSSALGKNLLEYYLVDGRISIDLMKIVQRDHKLLSYKLDNVTANFIKDNILDIKIDYDKKQSKIYTKNTYGLSDDRFIKFYYNDTLSDYDYKDKKKFKIHDLGEEEINGKKLNTITINDILDGEILEFKKYKVFWCQAKDDVSPADIFRLQKGNSADRAIIAKYCVQDCVLVNMLMEKLQVLTSNIGMANVCNVPLSYIILRGQGIKIFSYVSKVCRERNYLIPYLKKEPDPVVKGLDEKEAKKILEDHAEKMRIKHGYEGATVLRPNVGIHYKPISVLDYASLYPSSMIHRNLSLETAVLDMVKYGNLHDRYYYYNIEYYNKLGEKEVCTFVKPKDGTLGIVPQILTDLLRARKETRAKIPNASTDFEKNILDGLQLAYKQTANSLYGQTGARVSSIHMKVVAAATTATGREMLHGARLFVDYMFDKILNPILDNENDLYEERLDMLFDHRLEELVGPKMIKKLKKQHYKDNNDPKDLEYLNRQVDYHYLGMFKERREDLDDKVFAKFFNKIRNDKGHCKMFPNDNIENYNTRHDFYVYLKEEILKLLTGYAVNSHCVYGDTDSVFIDYDIRDINKPNEELTDRDTLYKAIKLGVLCGILVNFILPSPQDLEYEKTFWPWVILTKKKYVGNLYEKDPNSYYQNNMGIVLKRRDNAPIVKIFVGGIVDKILNTRSREKSLLFTRQELRKMLSGKYTIDKFILTKTLKGDALTEKERRREARKPKEERSYSDRRAIAHAVLADRMADRDPGNRPKSNERIPFVYKVVEGKVEVQGDRIEHPDYVIKNNIKIDYLFYITNQIMNPSLDFLQHLCDKPEKIFNNYIIREQNMRKGKKPIAYHFKNDTNENKGLKLDTVTDNFKEVKQIKKKNSTKKNVKIYEGKNIGFSLDDFGFDDTNIKKTVKKKPVKKKTNKSKVSNFNITQKNGGFIL